MYIFIQVMLYIIYITTHLWRSNFLIPFEIPTLGAAEPGGRLTGRAFSPFPPVVGAAGANENGSFKEVQMGRTPWHHPGFFRSWMINVHPELQGKPTTLYRFFFLGGECVCVFLGWFFLEEWWFLKKGSLFPAFGWRKGSSYYSVELWKPRSLSAMDLPRNQFYFLIASLESMKVGSTHVCPALLEVLSSESP